MMGPSAGTFVLAQLPGLEAPLVGFVDQLPQPALLALVAPRQPQLEALAPDGLWNRSELYCLMEIRSSGKPWWGNRE